jgi:hypothetical protein
VERSTDASREEALRMWFLFTAPCPTPDGRTAEDLYRKRETWITDGHLGDEGLVPVP